MSRYVTVKTQFTDPNSLIAALAETGGWSVENIEHNTVVKALFGYHGDKRNEKAHIIIRRKFVGRSSNDIGFVLGEDGNYEAIISAFDKNKYGDQWIGELKGNYAFHTIKREMESRGRSVSRERCPNGRQRLVITGYR